MSSLIYLTSGFPWVSYHRLYFFLSTSWLLFLHTHKNSPVNYFLLQTPLLLLFAEAIKNLKLMKITFGSFLKSFFFPDDLFLSKNNLKLVIFDDGVTWYWIMRRGITKFMCLQELVKKKTIKIFFIAIYTFLEYLINYLCKWSCGIEIKLLFVATGFSNESPQFTCTHC